MLPPVCKNAGDEETILAIAQAISPHIAKLCQDHRDDFATIIKGKADQIITSAAEDLDQAFDTITQEEEIKAAIRRYRARINHAVVMTDLFDLATVETHFSWLSEAARKSVDGITTWLTRQSGKAELNQGWFILALGKLGSGELNYSSDIDLIIITLPEHYDHHADYIRLTRRMTQILSQPTKDGIGWRVDLRLRPDPGATPIAINRDAAMSYYESLARTWERAAFIRATPIAGNIQAGWQFLEEITPFLWRKYLDYSVLEDMRVMLRREPRPYDLLGYNVKNGDGGIRSIEFFVHIQQLIAAGREKDLRQHRTHDALAALAQANWITSDDRQALSQAYSHWRRLEHRLQMIGDAQTHQMPKSEEQLAALARFCGHQDSTSFCRSIIALGDDVTRRTAPLMAKIGGGNDTSMLGSLLESQDDNSETLAAHLSEMGYDNPAGMIQTIQGWMAGRIPATRSERSRLVMARLLPKLLKLFAESEQPDISFGQFSRLVDALPAGLQLLSLLETNTELASTITMIMVTAPELGEQLARHPIVVDSLMYGEFWNPNINWQERQAEIEDLLAKGRDYEDKLDILRRTAREWKFRTALLMLTKTIDSVTAGEMFSRIAETLINAILPHVEEQLIGRFGQVETGGMVVLALGRLGSHEMTFRSDLDLIFIYEAGTDDVSDGKQSINASAWYARLGQQLINALTAQTAEGRCYNVDMRLRPSGNTGPVAIHIDGFENYQMNEAWVWEHMALLKARIIGGVRVDEVSHQTAEVISRALKKERQPENILKEVSEMRARLKKHFPPQSPADLRHREGGLMDLDFLIHPLQLMPAARDLPVHRRIRDAIPNLVKAGLLDEQTARDIDHSAEQFNDLQQWIRLTLAENRQNPDENLSLPKPFEDHFRLSGMAELHTFVDKIAQPVTAALANLLSSVEGQQ